MTPDAGQAFEVKSDSRDIAVWERVKNGRAFAQLQESMRFADLYEIAWYAAKRQQLFAGPLAEFEAGHALNVLKPEAADPTQSDPSTELQSS